MDLNKIYLGDSEKLLKELPDDYVDLVVTSPPYDNLRKYNGVGDTWNHEKFKKIANELERVLKPGGIIVWNVNDKTESGSETGTSFRQALYFMDECGLRLNDTMIWCLSGGEYLYVKTKNGTRPMMIKDMVRMNPDDVQLWGGKEWIKVSSWKENKLAKEKIRIQLRSGENIYCTNTHRWILNDNKEVLTSELKIGDVLKTCILPDNGAHKPVFLTKDILWLIGLYIAEGSHSEDTIQISLCSDEIEWVDRIKNAVESLGGTMTYNVDGNKLNVRCYSKIFNAVISQYVEGKTAKNKHLASICWQLSNDSIKEIISGYLDGDGHYDEENNRWRLGFTENCYLERDLRCAASRLGAKITMLRKGTRVKSLNKTYPSIRGEWRWDTTGHYNEKERSEILSITVEKMREAEKMWDIEVDSEDHIFSLASGVLTHNCKTNPMPQVKQPRYNQVFEYMFVFSKGAPKTFNPIMVPCKCAGQDYDSTCKNMGGENGRTKKHFKINKEKVDDNVWKFAISQNHSPNPAVYPIELPKRHILSWTNEGDIILDPFIGSGTTAFAAMELGRNFIGFEMNEEYFNWANEKIEEFSQKSAKKFSD